MTEDKAEIKQERQALRRQLRQAGWHAGEGERTPGGMRVALWPLPHTGPAEGVEPRWVEGVDRTDALRKAVRELGTQTPPDEPSPPGTASE